MVLCWEINSWHQDASVDTHINMTYVCHLSSVIADICLLCHSVIDDRCQMTDISHIDMGVYGSVWMSGIELQTQNHQNMHTFSLKLKMLNGEIFPLRFSDFLCILKTMVRFVNFRLLLPILFLLTSYGPYTAPICLHLHISGTPYCGPNTTYSNNRDHPLWQLNYLLKMLYLTFHSVPRSVDNGDRNHKDWTHLLTTYIHNFKNWFPGSWFLWALILWPN